MAVQSTFSKYVDSGSKLNKFKGFFDSLQSIGSLLNKIKGAIKAIQSGNLGLDALIKSKLDLKKLGLSGMLTSKMKELGLSDEACKFVSSKTDTFMDTMNDGVFSAYKTAESFATSLAQSLYNSLIGSIYVPEESFLVMVKGLVNVGGDPNYQNGYLRTVCLQQDLCKVLAWLDKYNNVNYTVGETRANDALTASKYGAFNVAKYIMKKIKLDYDEILNMPAPTDVDMITKTELLHAHMSYFYSVVKNIIVYSYANLTEADVRNLLNAYNIKPNEFGSTCKDYGGKFKINASDINVLAPFYRKKDIYDKTNYINPRNNNIKKIYLILTSSRIFGDYILVNKDLYDRLKNPIISTLQKSIDAAKDTFTDSPFGKFLSNAEDSVHGTIYKLTKEMKDILFNPKKQTYLSTKDCMVLPEPAISAMSTTTEVGAITNPTQYEQAQQALPQPVGINGKTLDYKKFYVYFKDNIFSDSKIIDDIFKINHDGIYDKYIEKIISKTTIDIETYEVTNENQYYYVFYKPNIYTEEEFNVAIEYVMTKYLIDLYPDLSLSDIMIMYQTLKVTEFDKYKVLKDSKETNNSGDTSDNDGYGGIVLYGKWKNYSSLIFYHKLLLKDNMYYICDGSSVKKYNIIGTLLYTITISQGIGSGIVLGVAIDEYENIYILTNSGVAVSFDDGLTYNNDNDVNISKMHISNNSGFSTLSQVAFHKVFYYEKTKTFYTATDNGIKYTSDNGVTYNWINSENGGLSSNICYGISITDDGEVYILTDEGVFGKAITDNTNFKQYSEYYENVFNLQLSGVGSVNNSVEIPYFSLDDFDIDDENIRKLIENNVITTQEMVWVYVD